MKRFSDAFPTHQTTLVYTNNEEKFFLHTVFVRAPRALSNNSYENNRSDVLVLVLNCCCTTEEVSNFPRCSLFSPEIASDKKVNSEKKNVKHQTNVIIALCNTCCGAYDLLGCPQLPTKMHRVIFFQVFNLGDEESRYILAFCSAVLRWIWIAWKFQISLIRPREFPLWIKFSRIGRLCSSEVVFARIFAMIFSTINNYCIHFSNTCRWIKQPNQ